jgi:hypothetical protein
MAKFVVNGKEYPVPEEFTLGEMCDAENFFGVDFSTDKVGARTVAATLYVAIRRVDQTVTVDDIRALPPDAFERVDKDDANPPSTPELAESSNGSSESSGETSPNGGADLAAVPLPTGTGS